MNSLKPLDSGNILLVGVKASNFDDEIRTNPRVIMWDSQQEHWTNKGMPSNTRAVFMTRFISHATSTKLLAEARRRKITIFNPQGTGLMTQQVKELLNMTTSQETTMTPTVQTSNRVTIPPLKNRNPVIKYKGKMERLIQFIDLSKNNLENAHVMFEKAKEMGIQTTVLSIAQFMSVYRRRVGIPLHIHVKSESVNSLPAKQVDVSVEILDNLISELNDMRSFLIATVEENRVLKSKLDKFKKAFEDA